MELRVAKTKKVCLPFLFFFSLLCVSFSEFLVAILDNNSFCIYIYIYILVVGGVWSGSQKRMTTTKRSSQEMCKPYYVIDRKSVV